MATVKEYFDTDFPHFHTIHKTNTLASSATGLETDVVCRVHFHFDSNGKFISYFIPSCINLAEICFALLDNIDWALSATDDFHVEYGFPFEGPMKLSDLKFSGRIFIYSENQLTNSEISFLNQYAEQNGLSLRFRGSEFAKKRAAIQKPIAFISHDSRDKDEIARPLAIELVKLMCPVWYDEFSLKVGDSLRESIEKGIKECKKCVLIISPHFLANNGWTKVEFSSIFTRQIIEHERIVIPIWHNVTPQEVYEYSPSLADNKAIIWAADITAVSREIYRAITT